MYKIPSGTYAVRLHERKYDEVDSGTRRIPCGMFQLLFTESRNDAEHSTLET